MSDLSSNPVFMSIYSYFLTKSTYLPTSNPTPKHGIQYLRPNHIVCNFSTQDQRISIPKSAFISLKYGIQYLQYLIGQHIWVKNARILSSFGQESNSSIVCNFYVHCLSILDANFQPKISHKRPLYKALTLSPTFCMILAFPCTNTNGFMLYHLCSGGRSQGN